jgi:hypothetical protein
MCDHVRHTEKVDRLLVGLILSLSPAMLATPAPAAAVDADLLFRGGTIHDGSGAEPVVGDVAARDGRIVSVGKVTPGKIGRTIDCQGLVVAPGLIDLHTHTDGTLAQPGCRAALNYLMQGCTTMCTGNCGGSKDVVEFLNDVDAGGAGTNIMHLVGHGTIRRAVMGSERREPTAEELQRMKGLVDQAMRDGAWGMSTGLIYAPGSYAQTEEIVALAKVVAAHGGIYATHIRPPLTQVRLWRSRVSRRLLSPETRRGHTAPQMQQGEVFKPRQQAARHRAPGAESSKGSLLSLVRRCVFAPPGGERMGASSFSAFGAGDATFG